MSNAVAYFRVSTRRQHRSGLGIEAQRAAVTRFGEAEGITIVGEFVEAETGKVGCARSAAAACSIPRSSRPGQMQRAGLQARQALTRRSIRFRADGATRAVHRGRVGPRCRSLHAAPLRGPGREGRQLISERTKAALAAKKASGAKLGNPRNIAIAGFWGRNAQIAPADEFAAGLLPL